jgi:hypothetical protein
MRIDLLSDYRGVLTHEDYYPAGQYDVPGMMPDAHAEALLKAGRAVVVKTPVRRVSRKRTKK